MSRCTVCSNPLVSEVDLLLATGSSVRKVAQLYGIPRATLARHKAHIAPTSGKFAVISGPDGPSEPPGPLEEALLLAARARTPRERLRGLEAVRAAARLALRSAGTLDQEGRELLESNIRAAERAYRDAGDFETQARALAGWREAIAHRLDATGADETVEVAVDLTWSDSEPVQTEWLGSEPPTFREPLATYLADVPRRFHDLDRYTVRRTIRLSLVPARGRT